MSNLDSSLFAILLRCEVPPSLPLSVSYYLWSLVSCSPPPTTHHHPPQNVFTLRRIWYPGSRLTSPRHFLQIPLFSCLLWVVTWWGVVVGVVGVAIFTLLKLARTWIRYLTSPNLSWQILVRNGSSNIFCIFNNCSLTDDNCDNSKCEKELTGLLLDSVMWPSDEQQDCQSDHLPHLETHKIQTVKHTEIIIAKNCSSQWYNVHT